MKFLHKRCYLILLAMIILGGIFVFPVAADDANPVVLMFDVQGNTHVPAEKVLGAISNSRIGAPLDPGLVQQDMQAIHDLGYFADVRATTEKLFNGVKLVFVVVENPLFKELRISGLTKVKPQELQQFFTQKPGEVFSTTIFQENLGNALKYCQEKKGFFIRPAGDSSAAISADGVIQLNLAELKYGKTKILGLLKTKEQVVRRELTFKEGDIIDINALQASMMNMMRSRLFDGIEPKFEAGEAPDSLDLVLEMKEAQTGSFSFGGSYNDQVHELGAVLGYSESNLMGLGQSLGIDINLAESTKNVQMNFNEPWLDNHQTSFGLSVYNTDAYMYSTMKTWFPTNPDNLKYYMHFVKTGISLSLGRPIAKDTVASLALIAEKNSIKSYYLFNSTTNAYDTQSPDSSTASVPMEFWDNALQLSIVKNRLRYADSNFVNGGSLLSGVLKSSGKYLGGYFDYQRATVDWKGFHALSPNLVFGNRMELGYQTGDYPDYNQLYLGGMMRLRGYTDQMFDNPNLIGDHYWLNNSELRFRLPSSKNIEFVLFGDAGQMYKTSTNAATFKYDYGVGIRLNVPMLGVLRFDQAWNGDNGSNFVFSINELF